MSKKPGPPARFHVVADPTLEALLGIALAGLGFWVTHNAFEGRNRSTPWVLKPFTPW